MLPAVSAALELVERRIPNLASEIQEGFFEEGLTASPFHISGLESVFEFDDEKAPFEVVEHESLNLVVPSGMGAFVGDVNSIAGRLVSRWGVSTVSEVCAQTDMSVSPELVRLILASRPDVRWLDENEDWFSLLDQRRNRLLNMTKKVLSVAPSLKVTELRKAVSRHHKMRGFAPPQSVLLNFCKTSPLIVTNGDVVSAVGQEKDTVLGTIEQEIVRVLKEIGPVARSEEIEERCLGRGMNRNSFYIYLSYSPLVQRLSKGVYGLVGAAYSPTDIEALSEKVRNKVLIDSGWTDTGRIWIAFHLTLSNLRTGIFNIPNNIKEFISDGTFDVTNDGESLGYVKINNGVLFGLNMVFERRGGDAGDIIVIEIDSIKKQIIIEVDGLDLLYRYSEGQGRLHPHDEFVED